MPAVPMKKIDLRWFGECSPKHRQYSLMFAKHSVTIAECSLMRWLVIHRAILLRCIGEHQRSFGDASPRHQVETRGVGGGEEGGGVDLYKFLSWFMSVIFLYYFTCMILSRVCVHFHCLLFFVQCTELDGILHYK